jgi:hypothetical protein
MRGKTLTTILRCWLKLRNHEYILGFFVMYFADKIEAFRPTAINKHGRRGFKWTTIDSTSMN